MTGTTRRTLFKSTMAAGAAFAARGEKPNILMILSDDHSAAHAGCYGNKVIRTPNIDAFAAEGMRFDRAYTTSPQCSPSRASIFTGQSPQRVNMTRLHAVLPREHKTFFEHLRAAGYQTGVAGRTYHTDGHLVNRPWFRDLYQREKLPNMRERVDFVDVSPQDRCVDVLNQFVNAFPKGKPFALQLNLTDPHSPWTATDIESQYDPREVPLPPHLPDSLEMRKRLVKYYAEVTRADRDFGRILDYLKRSGLDRNTMVVFMGDNGYSFPFGKCTLYQAGWHVPLLVRWPGHVKAGSSTSELVSGSDFFATYLEAAGLPVPDGIESRSFLPALEGRAHNGRKYVFCSRGWHDTMDLGRAVCSKSHSLIYNVWPEHKPLQWPSDFDAKSEQASGKLDPRVAELWTRRRRPLYEMYDLNSDPHELTNVASQAAYGSAQFELMTALTEWMEASSDFIPPPFLNSQKLDADPLHQAAPRLQRNSE